LTEPAVSLNYCLYHQSPIKTDFIPSPFALSHFLIGNSLMIGRGDFYVYLNMVYSL
jgi:hypothetical protein